MMHKPWTSKGWSTSAAELLKDGKRVAVIDFNPTGGGYFYNEEITFILAALNEKETRDRKRDETQ